jgi:predicted SnoaL-like aldol condensation-catalyzing enzyme
MVHGRYTAWGAKPVVGMDIFRVADGKVVEHWDVLQEEVPADFTKSVIWQFHFLGGSI